MIENEIFLLDTNVLVYNYGISDMSKHKIAKQLIDTCWAGEGKFCLSSQILSEFFWVTTRKHFLAKKEALTVILDIIQFPSWIKIDFNHKTVIEAARISEEFNMVYWDSLLAATMRENNIFNIYTENAKDFKMPWLNAVNPFEKR